MLEEVKNSGQAEKPFRLKESPVSDRPSPFPPRGGLERRALDVQLREFLEGVAVDKAEGNTIANLRIELHQVRQDMNEVITEQRLMKLRLDRHGRDIRAIKQQLDLHVDGTDLDTDVHQLDDLKKHLAAKEAELKERRDSLWWRRQKATWLMAALGGGVVMVLGAIGTFVWWLFTRTVK